VTTCVRGAPPREYALLLQSTWEESRSMVPFIIGCEGLVVLILLLSLSSRCARIDQKLDLIMDVQRRQDGHRERAASGESPDGEAQQ
jgi:hypothetical protein